MTGFEELVQMGELGSQYGATGTMDPMVMAFFAWFAGVGIVILALIVLLIISRCFVFEKMGNKWYEAIISGHNIFVLVTKAGKPGRWVFAPVIMIIPVIGRIVGGILSLLIRISVNLGLAKRFGKGTWFGVGLILLPFIFYPIVAWGKAKYSVK
jgi:hypothetical protein